MIRTNQRLSYLNRTLDMASAGELLRNDHWFTLTDSGRLAASVRPEAAEGETFRLVTNPGTTHDTVAFLLSTGDFFQDWSSIGQITTNDNWSGVPSITGFLGQDITTGTGIDPQTLTGDSAVANDLDVIANQSNPNITNGGVAEFDGIANPTIALQGSGTADAPHIVIALNTTGEQNITVSYVLRDLDATTDNAVMPVALQYRIGSSGAWTNVPAAFVADATSGPSLATLTTNVSALLPAAVNNQALVQIRIITTNAVGNDEWVGVDDIRVQSDPIAVNPGALSIDSVTHAEGDSGTTVYTFTVTRSGGSSGTVGATWTLGAPGGAGNADSADFIAGQATSGTVSFADGETFKTITINVQGDDDVEGNEAFTVALSAPTGGATIPPATATGTGTITNDDAAGILSIGDVTLAEGNAGTTAFSFVVARNSGDDGAVGATWTLVAPGGANLADLADFAPGQPTSGAVSFADGETSKTITILVQGDVSFEDEETFLVVLSAPTGGATLNNVNGTGTITNDDAAPAGTFSIADLMLAEGNSGTTNFTFTVTRSGGSAGAVSADYTIAAPGGAGNADSADFVVGAIFSGQVNFANGETSKTITIGVQGDTDFEGDEGFTVTLSNATGGATIGDGVATGTILNDDAAPAPGSVSVADMSIVEGNAGTSILIFTLTRTGGTGAFDVNYATSNGGDPTHASATAGSDYVAASGTASFAFGQTTATVSITINGDVTPELSEEFTLTLSGATNGATISDGTAIGTITNDDTPPSTINIWTENFDSFLGGGFSPTPAAGQLDSDVYITAGFDDPTNPSVDYGGTVTTGDLARGVTAVAVTTGGIYSLDRTGGNHAFLVQPGGTDFTPGTFTMRLVNTSGLAADTFAIAYDILVRNDQGRSNSFNLSYSTDGVNFVALSAFNYTSPDAADALGLVTVARAGQFTTASSITAGGFLYLRFTGDDVGGSGSRDEFGLDNISVGVAGGSATPTVAVSDVSVNEAAGTMTFTITRTNLVGTAFSVDYATANGSATAGSDYVAASGTLNFADNQVSATVTVTINNDGIAEIDETLFLNLSNATNGALITDAQGQGTILNDDGTPIQISIGDVSINEGNSGTQILTFTVSRSGGTGAFDVSYATANDSATAPSDYVAAGGTLNFAAGQNSQTISITINGDLTPEQTEQFFVNLSAPTNNAVIIDGQGIGTIINDEGTFIHDIQGTAYFSPILAGEGITTFNTASTAFVTVSAIVTAVDNDGNRQGFYISEEFTDWDGNKYTSEGIFVMTRTDASVGSPVSSAGVAVGDLVTVTARVMEYQGFSTNMPITALVNASSIVVNSSGNTLPAFFLDASHPIPNSIMTLVTPDYTDSSDGAGDTFDAALYGLSYWETVEGMLVTIPDMVVADGFVGSSGGRPFLQAYSTVHADADQINSRGGYTIAGDPPNSPPDTPETDDATTNGGRVLHDGDINPDIIEVDWTGWAAAPPTGLATGASMGDLLGDVTGIIDFDFTDRKLFVTAMEPGGFVDNGSPVQETTLFGDDDRSLTVATFNVENLDPGDGAARFTALANAIANNLNAPDIICVEEMQDNNGATASGGADASTTWNMLVSALNAATGKVYQWVDQEPVPGAEGGEPGGNIRVGFIYDTGRVQLGDLPANASLDDRRKYTDRIGDGVRDSGDLIAFSDNMLGGEINTADWTTTRKSLLGQFTFHGNAVYVTANHWPSKGGSGNVWQFNQDLGSGQPNNSDWAQRNQVAQDVYSMLNLIQSSNPNAGIVSGGDYNDFYFYRPLEVMTGYVLPDGSVRSGGARFDNLTLTLPEAERYTYAFDGRSQAIDHIIANGLLSAVAGYDVVHLNTGYNPSGSPALSDHDPGVASFDYRNFSEVLRGTAGVDMINGFGGDDVILGNSGADVLDGGTGKDVLIGEIGDDIYFVDSAGDYVAELSGQGYDRVYAGVSYTLYGGQYVELLSTAAPSDTTALTLGGNELDNIIIGNNGVNTLYGKAGFDVLYGLGGDDIYLVGDAGELIVEESGGGNDRVLASTDYTLYAGSQVETLSTDWNAGTAAITLGGNERDNLIIGNDGANTLYGKGGNDTLVGHGGADTFLFVSQGAGDVDAILDFTTGADKIALSHGAFTALSFGALPAGSFATGTSAHETDDRIIYNQSTGQLYYDADGSGAGAQILFATLVPGTALVASDIIVV